ncbi:MAG TPA: polyphosphate kinase 1 [Longimicrobiales bacterium]
MPDITRSTLPIAVRAARVPANAELNDPSLLFNRELSWIDFNWRVIYQALDERTPLLERARFLAIAQRNLDEFIAKRVGGLKSQQHAGVTGLSPDGLSPTEQLSLLRTAILEMQQRMADAWQKDLRGRVQAEAGVRIIDDWTVLSAEQAEELHALFRSNVYPILTPLVVDLGHPFPFISHLSLSLAIVLEDAKRGTRHFARLKLPLNRGRWVKFGDGSSYIAMEKLITRYAQELFPGMQVRGTHAFRVTRNAEVLDAESGEAEDLLQMISEELRERRFAPVVRLEVAASMPEDVRELLMSELELDPRDVHPVDGPIDLTCLDTFADLDVPALRFPPWEPVTPPPLLRAAQTGDVDIFAVVRAGDMLVHHPYESFSASVEAFVERAATDHRVLAIKQTLYRVSDDSRVARALIRAAEEGKQVAVLIEVTASLDEQRNIDIAQRMEKAGVHVAYGMMGLKTHTKITLVVREEPDAIRTYCHIGTGNYHERTARLYSDIGLFTASEQVGLDVVNMFHFLTGMAPEQDYTNLLVAPRDMRAELTALVEEEIRHGPDGHIILKMNGLDDVDLIRTLYRASRAGVRVDLIVRGHTRLRPGIPGVSENISLISILGRFLEHDRIFYFRNNGDPQIFIGSADWRRRNLEERVEALVRIDDPALKERLRFILDTALTDNRSAWDLHADGRYQLRCPGRSEEVRSFQDILMQRARDVQGVVRRAS